jgi:hypothetical protein
MHMGIHFIRFIRHLYQEHGGLNDHGVDFGLWDKIDPADPVKYDFALFGIGIYEEI